MEHNNEQVGVLEQNIEVLNINANILKTLKKHKISTLKKLSQQTKKDLVKLGFSSVESKKIEIELQLQGLDLK